MRFSIAMAILFIGLIASERSAFLYPANNMVGERVIITFGWIIIGFEIGRWFQIRFGLIKDPRDDG